MLVVDNLSKSYNRRRVVDRVSFSVNPGEIIGLLGQNGAGKTTTFRMTIGMIRADEGQVRFFDQDISSLPMYRRAQLGMGYLSQESSVFRGLTVQENIDAILEVLNYHRAQRREIRESLLEEFGLAKLRKSKATNLSGGEKRRLEIARCLVTSPKLVLLDEPFSGVDPIAVADIQDHVYRLKEKGIAVLLTDHNVRETLATTDKSYIIYEGRIIARGNKKEILEDENARKYYLGERFEM